MLFESDPVTALPNALLLSIRTAWILMQTGDEERGRKLAESVLEIIEHNGAHIVRNFEDVAAHAALGDSAKALELLSASRDRGRYMWWYLEHDPIFNSLRDAPEFQAVLDELTADMDAQRAALEAEGLMTVPSA